MKHIKLVMIAFALILLVAAPLVAVDSPSTAAYKQAGETFMGTNTRV